MNYRLDAAPETEQLEHLVNAPGDAPYCGYENAWPDKEGSRGGRPRTEHNVKYAGQIVTVLYIEDVTCEVCLHAVIARTMESARELDLIEDPNEAQVADKNDLDARLKEAVERLGELSLKRHHPAQYAELMLEKQRPPEPRRLGAIVRDQRGVHFLRESVSSICPWREFGAVRLGIEGEDDKRWDELPGIVKVVFQGIEQ